MNVFFLLVLLKMFFKTNIYFPLHQNSGYILYESGYDVWMANARGNVYSRGHLKYNRNGWRSDRKKYWNFSWHEIGKYDIPATIDYILEKTNFTKVHYIGHSQVY